MKRFLLHLAPLPVLVACIYPFAWMFFSSFKTNREIYRPAQLLPANYEWDSYSALWSGEYLPFLDYFIHSILVSGGQAILATLVTAAAGFAFAKFGFRGSGWLFGVAVLVILVISWVLPRIIQWRRSQQAVEATRDLLRENTAREPRRRNRNAQAARDRESGDERGGGGCKASGVHGGGATCEEGG